MDDLPPDASECHRLGLLAHQQGKTDMAVAMLRRALVADRSDADVWNNLAVVFRSAGQLSESIEAARMAVSLRPAQAEFRFNLGMMLRTAGRQPEAIDAFAAALNICPDYPDALASLAAALTEAGRIDEAIAACQRGLSIDPKHVPALNNLGNALKILTRFDEAAQLYRQVIALAPGQARAHNNLGVVLRELGQIDESIACFQTARALAPELPETYNNLAVALKTRGDFDAAIDCLQQAVALKPTYVEALNNLGLLFKDVGRMTDSVAACRRAVQADPARPAVHSNLIYAMLFHPATRQQDQALEERAFADRHAAPLRRQSRPSPGRDGRRLRVGYLSPDFRHHAAANFLLPLFAHHDHTCFEIHAFSSVLRPDAITEQLKLQVDRWHQIAPLNDADAARLIEAEEIDVLVDLTLHMAGGRPLLLARQPAPLQVTWLGYPGSTGLTAVDYRLTDPYLDPPGLNDSFYAEQTWRLPRTFWCYDPMGVDLPVSDPPFGKNGFVTFGCLNNFCKVSDRSLDLWASIMRATPQSRLMLLAPIGSARQRVAGFLADRGISADRVQFVSGCNRGPYMARYQQIDLMLDTVPYNGHTTSLDGLWMGVPLVTLALQPAVSRAGLSLLSNLDLAEWVASDDRQFVELATRLASDRHQLAALRRALRPRMEQSPLMDGAAFSRDFEEALTGMVSAATRPSAAQR